MTTIVIGLDGAHWELLNPWLNKGLLPNINKLRQEGVWGNLQSCLPPVTSPNWQCYATGKNPGKLGVYWWEIVDVANREIRSPQSLDFHSSVLWDYLASAGHSTYVINMPTMYPPKGAAEAIIAGGPDAEDTDYTIPAELESELRDRFGYRVHPEYKIRDASGTDEATVRSHLDIIESRFDVAEWLLDSEDPEFLHVTTFYLNVLQHYYWNGEPTKRAWKRIDNRIGDLMDADHDLLLMSDHGATDIEWEVNLNRWLQEEGYLSLDDGASGTLARLGVTRELATRLLDVVPFRKAVLDLVPSSVKSSVPNEDGTLPKSTKGDLVNWKHSKALASGQGPIYLLVDDEDERKSLAKELTDKIIALRDPSGNPVFEEVHRGDELYHGPYMELAPELVAEQRSGYHVPGKISGDSVFARPQKWSGENKKTGLFAVWGRDVADGGPFDGSDGEPLSILDLMPTVLHWLGEPVPEDVDGDVRRDVFVYGSETASRDPTSVAPIAPRETGPGCAARTVEDRLENLGYL